MHLVRLLQLAPMLPRTAIYLDSNAGAPLHPRVVEALRALFSAPSGAAELIPNPSSIHSHGRQAKRWFAEARESVAASLGPKADTEQLIFTSSCTEANQLAIVSALEPVLLKGGKPHWITTPVEHDSVLQMVSWLIERGGSVSMLPVDSSGQPDITALESLWKPGETALVSALWVNNETGVISDIPALAAAVRARGGLLHVDAAQAWGKLPIVAEGSGISFLTLSGHKIGALAGTGVLYVGKGVRVHSILRGKQEKGRRGGTENLLGIIAAGAAASAVAPGAWAGTVQPLRDRFEDAIRKLIPGVSVNGEGAPRVANTSNLSFEGVEGDSLVMALDLAGVSVSSGSACASGVLEPSHVLLAMGRTPKQAMAALRVSLSSSNTWDELEAFLSALEPVVARVRKAAVTAAGLKTTLVTEVLNDARK